MALTIKGRGWPFSLAVGDYEANATFNAIDMFSYYSSAGSGQIAMSGVAKMEGVSFGTGAVLFSGMRTVAGACMCAFSDEAFMLKIDGSSSACTANLPDPAPAGRSYFITTRGGAAATSACIVSAGIGGAATAKFDGVHASLFNSANGKTWWWLISDGTNYTVLMSG